jgi:acyl transferase domain-containing protein/thioesterase domain-containing protein
MGGFRGNRSSEIAIIGLSLRVPGADNERQFWHNLSTGTESLSVFADDELDLGLRQRVLVNRPDFVKSGGILEDIDRFDAEFFGCSAREAQLLDPQQRLFLQACWEALESAGYDPDRYAGSIGVYAGAGINTYFCLNLLPSTDITDFATLQSIVTKNDKDYLCSRVAYKLNLHGPAVVVQTACSTSLVAVHLACQSLLAGECDMALAGGVSIRVPQRSGYLYQEGGILSPDGHCRPFDSQACGTVASNGLGVVVLKRLDYALRDHDLVRAVILGSAINNDGSRKVGFMAPSIDGQASAIAEAQAVAQVTPDSIGYIETHGTGTELGDPIEIRALNKVFSHHSIARNSCALGSVKGNLGHLDTAAGVVGLIKSVLCLENRELPPMVNFREPNPKLELDRTPFWINYTSKPWMSDGRPRRAGVSSFGIGGTNAHVVLQEAPSIRQPEPTGSCSLFLLSARTTTALEQVTSRLRAYIEERNELCLEHVAYTLQTGRRHFAYRRMFVPRGKWDALHLLNGKDPTRIFDSVVESKNPRVSLLLPDQGIEHIPQASEWYQNVRPFVLALDDCARILCSRLGTDVRDFLHPNAGRSRHRDIETGPVADAWALFSVEFALARTLIEWGLQPEAMLGIGIGECVAACIAGVLPLETALTAVACRVTRGNSGLVACGPPEHAQFHVPKIPFISPVTGSWIADEQSTNPDYWLRYSSKPMLIGQAMMTFFEETDAQAVDLGPGSRFKKLLGEQHVVRFPRRSPPIAIFRETDNASGESECPWRTLGHLWLSGVAVNWAMVQPNARCQRLSLPTYPFEGQSYWIAPPNNLPHVELSVPAASVVSSRPATANAYLVPRSKTEVQLTQIWEEILGYNPIGVNDDFFELGGDSLAALQIASRIRQIFPLEVPVQKLAQACTVAQLAELIEERSESHSDSALPLAEVLGTSPLIVLQKGDESQPFFCVHPAGGTVLCYVPLARLLGSNQTFFGLQAPALYGGEEPPTIEEKAHLYLQLIRQSQPRGPYRIGGHSYGGNVAFEIACQLLREGDEVALLALLDSYPPEAYQELPSPEQFREAFPRVVASYFGLDTAQEMEPSLILSNVRTIYPDLTTETIEKFFQIWFGHFRALQAYRPSSTYSREITYFCCESDADIGIVNPTACNISGSRRADAWSRFSLEPIRIHWVPGNHFSLLRSPHVETLAVLLQRAIDGCLSNGPVRVNGVSTH